MKYVILFLVLFVFACSPEPVPETVQETQEEPQEPEPSPVPVEEVEMTPENSQEVKELQEQAGTVNNYKFSYSELSDDRITRTYYFRGDNVRVELYTPPTRDAGSFDVVYLNLDTREAAAYCEQGNSATCPDPEEKVTNPDFEEYYFTPPHELIQNLEGAEVTSGLTYEDIVVDVVKGELDGEQVTMYVHSFFGVPLYIEYASGEGFGLRDASFNSVSEAQVNPPRW